MSLERLNARKALAGDLYRCGSCERTYIVRIEADRVCHACAKPLDVQVGRLAYRDDTGTLEVEGKLGVSGRISSGHDDIEGEPE